MFKNLSNKLFKVLSKISNYGRLTEKNIKDTLHEIYISLLEADVALDVIKNFIFTIKQEAIGKNINHSFTPGQELIQLVKKNLIKIISSPNNKINISVQPPATILLVGLQGAGKTTSVVKLAYFLKKKYKKKIIVVSTDIYRPAAIEQLKILAKNTQIDYFNIDIKSNPIEISKQVLNYVKVNFYDILIVDTAGRLHINHRMMEEIKDIHAILNPIETLFVIDAMTGQDSINSAKAFNKILPITGVFLTKTDSDARGGVALSVKYITQKPIKFIGTGEKISDMTIFSPENIATKILGMSSELSIIKNIKDKINYEKNQKLIKKLQNKSQLSLQDFLDQLKQIYQIGSNNITTLLNKMKIGDIQNLAYPILNTINVDQKMINNIEVMMNSMTKLEKINVEIINFSRKKRISLGSGISIQKIHAIFKQYNQMKLITKKITKKNNMNKIIKNMQKFFPKKIF
ncbi:signal recognition particle protein [Enterobacteriaceae endosymbiont of Donacia tomentosa]|uniref:signal recognition particle protein n=1 Tax=Enterobacteriaceae endosymbiont of Donacia tomentosa TaxID=2675787 RepID=UPI001449B546|nr:signal recognition particle receptor subunit alpha [Enterobacteriaceae endosymbiont of Donacia tomentosa]QJC31824.1 signal recognition particle protein [Enterobacteriaceae endosymbiont of Donacia tomentosa]